MYKFFFFALLALPINSFADNEIEILTNYCDSGNAIACINLGFNYENGKGVTKDLKKANSLFEKACSLDYGLGCNNLGYNYQYGNGVTKDLNKANSFYEKACSLGEGEGCYNLGLNYAKGNGVTKDLKKANILEASCICVGKT